MSTKKFLQLLVLLSVVTALFTTAAIPYQVTKFDTLWQIAKDQGWKHVANKNPDNELCYAKIEVQDNFGEVSGFNLDDLYRAGLQHFEIDPQGIQWAVFKVSYLYCEGGGQSTPQPAGEMSPVRVNTTQPSPWTTNAIAMAGLAVVVLLVIAAKVFA